MPTRNGEAFLDRVMAALGAQQIGLPWDVLAIDSGSTDRTLEILERWRERFPVRLRVRQIHPTAFDHGDTRNLLAAESTGDLLVFLTQDAIPSHHGWLATLAGNFTDSRVGAAYCRNVPRPDAQILTRVFSEHDPGYSAARREQILPDAATYARMDPTQKRLLFNMNDVASAVRRALWERHPFPRTTFGEDILMARALIEAGHVVVYDDVATVEHSHDYSPDEMEQRAREDGRFNIEWLERVCVNSLADAETLTDRQVARDREVLTDAGLAGAALETELERARRLRRAAFVGMYEGGRSSTRRRASRMLPRSTLRVLYVVHGFPPDTWAGTEVYTLSLARAMKARGHDVAILTRAPAPAGAAPDAPADFTIDRQDFQGLPVWRMINRLGQQRLRDSYVRPAAEAAFRDALREIKPDIVHFQHLIHLSVRLPEICRELGVPSLITVNDYWALCARVQLIRPDGVRCEENQGLGCLLCVKNTHLERIPAARRFGAMVRPLAAIGNALRGRPGMTSVADRSGEIVDMADRQDVVCGGYDACDLIVAPSRFLRQKHLDTGRFDPHKVVYSDYGIPAPASGPPIRAASGHPGVRFGFIGSLLWYKGVDVLIRAVHQLASPAAVLHIHGDFKPETDPYHAALAELARPCGERVIFHGRFDNQQVGRVYEHIDVLVVPSTWFENSPITIHEAFQFRTPIVTSDIGGMAELVHDGVDGLHFRAGDAADLCGKLARFVDDPGLAARLSNQVPEIKSIDEDAREMEFRYRGLAARVPAAGPQ